MQEDVRDKKPKNSKVSNKSEIKQSNRNPHWEPPGHSEDLYGSSISLEVGLKDSNHIPLYKDRTQESTAFNRMREVGEKDGGVLKPHLHSSPLLIWLWEMACTSQGYLALLLLHKLEGTNWCDDALRVSMQVSHCWEWATSDAVTEQAQRPHGHSGLGRLLLNHGNGHLQSGEAFLGNNGTWEPTSSTKWVTK